MSQKSDGKIHENIANVLEEKESLSLADEDASGEYEENAESSWIISEEDNRGLDELSLMESERRYRVMKDAKELNLLTIIARRAGGIQHALEHIANEQAESNRILRQRMRQIRDGDVRLALTHNVGAHGATCAVHIFERR